MEESWDMHNMCTEIFTKNVYTVSNMGCMAQHVCDSVLVWTASCSNSTTPCIWRWIDTKRVDRAGHCSYPLLEGLGTVFLYCVNILQTLRIPWSWWGKIGGCSYMAHIKHTERISEHKENIVIYYSLWSPSPLLVMQMTALNGFEELVQMLLENGANPFSRNEVGRAMAEWLIKLSPSLSLTWEPNSST